MRQPINYEGLPEHLRAGMRRYIEFGVRTGRLQAQLENDIERSFLLADEHGMVREVADWIRDNVPAEAWGNPLKVKAWIDKHAAKLEASA